MVVDVKVVEHKEDDELVVVMENGLGKRTKFSEYKLQGRGGTGLKVANITVKTGKLAGAKVIAADKVQATDIFMISEQGQMLRTALNSVKRLNRVTQGVKLMKPKDGDKIVSITLLDSDDSTEDKKTK
ncbi:MAG: DNA gyrase C-terminal beta-propeller domain-containing protein [Patescibacteria group bacterium]|nr:DNA gyrase C-terminal beta-propeller domain-containing protein [Patescibacteria group bacterium]